MKYLILLLGLIGSPSSLLGQQAAPEIALSANGTRDLNLFPGWPLIVDVTIMNSSRHDRAAASPLVLAPAGADWTSTITFTAVSSSGQTTHWPFTLVGLPGTPALTLARSSYVNVSWQMSATATSALPPGSYQLTASLALNNSSGWNGTVASLPVAITIGPEPTLGPDEQSRKSLLLAEYSLNSGELNDAVTTTQELRKAQPNNPAAAAAAANVLAAADLRGLALLQASDALKTYYLVNPSPNEAPSDLLTTYQGLLANVSISDAPAATSVIAPQTAITFSPSSQSVPLGTTVTVANGTVNGGLVTFTATGIAGSATSGPVTEGAASATFLVPGNTPAAAYALKAAYAGTTQFSPSNDLSGSLTIGKGTPVIAWSTPADVAAGTVLGSSQLNATANVPGTFVYEPPAGTVLSGTSSELLNVTFTPTDSTDYNSTTAAVSLRVIAGSYSGSVSPSEARIKIGDSETFSVTLNSANYAGEVSLSCVNPPAGISCRFSTDKVTLVANSSSTSALTVSVGAKPQSSTLILPHGWTNAGAMLGTRTSRERAVLVLFAVCLVMAGLVALGKKAKPVLRFSLTGTLFVLITFALNSCTSATWSGPAPGGSGGGTPATVHIVVQGAAGGAVQTFGTLSITVP